MLKRVVKKVKKLKRILTIKLNDIEPNTLHPSPCATSLVVQPTLLISLSLRQFPRNNQRQCNDRKDNTNSSISPPPVGFVELVGQGGSRKRSDHIRRGGESVSQTTIPEGGCIRRDHVN